MSLQDQFDQLTGVSDEDTWKFDRQQNIVESVNASIRRGDFDGDDVALETATIRQNEARSIQRLIIERNSRRKSVDDDLDQADEDWVRDNPNPRGTRVAVRNNSVQDQGNVSE